MCWPCAPYIFYIFTLSARNRSTYHQWICPDEAAAAETLVMVAAYRSHRQSTSTQEVTRDEDEWTSEDVMTHIAVITTLDNDLWEREHDAVFGSHQNKWLSLRTVHIWLDLDWCRPSLNATLEKSLWELRLPFLVCMQKQIAAVIVFLSIRHRDNIVILQRTQTLRASMDFGSHVKVNITSQGNQNTSC